MATERTKKLIMFDIDGTLTATTDIDARCFIQAVENVLDIDDIDTDLANYTHVTDESIALEVIERHTGRKATEMELFDIRRCFVGLIEKHTRENPDNFHPINGAGEMLELLSNRPDCGISLATGGWRSSAMLKIEASGLRLDHVPMVTSDDALSREEIMQLSEEQAQSVHGVGGFDSVVYVGDGTWDLRSSRSMGYHFIGVGKGDRARRLRDEGAKHIVPDFTEENGFFHILETLWENY